MSESFMSEYTAEFILVPQFIDILLKKYKQISPLYFWNSREGSNLAKTHFENKTLRVIAMYARRPKISAESGTIKMKINDELYQKSAYLEDNGIPVFTGIPLVTSLEDFNYSARCAWVYLQSKHPIEHLQFIIQEKNRTTKQYRGLTPENILEIIESRSRPMKWIKAVEVIKNNNYKIKSRKNNSSFLRGLFGERYKPVYFIAIEG
jgi:hypothetical protein